MNTPNQITSAAEREAVAAISDGFDTGPESPDYREMQEFCAERAHAARRPWLGVPGYADEPAHIAADLAYSRMKADGTLQSLADHRALVDQIKGRVL